MKITELPNYLYSIEDIAEPLSENRLYISTKTVYLYGKRGLETLPKNTFLILTSNRAKGQNDTFYCPGAINREIGTLPIYDRPFLEPNVRLPTKKEKLDIWRLYEDNIKNKLERMRKSIMES